MVQKQHVEDPPEDLLKKLLKELFGVDSTVRAIGLRLRTKKEWTSILQVKGWEVDKEAKGAFKKDATKGDEFVLQWLDELPQEPGYYWSFGEY